MTTYAKKAAFPRDSALLMGRFCPRERCRPPKKLGVLADLTQSPGLLRFSLPGPGLKCLVRVSGQVLVGCIVGAGERF